MLVETANKSAGLVRQTSADRLTQTPPGLATTRVGTQTFGYTNNHLNTYSYDAAGNQMNDGTHTYVFDADNKIKQMDGGSTVYAYDGEGRRVRKIVGSETTYFFYAYTIFEGVINIGTY